MLGSVRVVRRRREDDIEGELEGLLDHVRDDFVEEGTADIETGIGVDLNEPRLALGIYHEV